MRCYHLCNMYLVGVHAGIQSAHTQHELAIKYLASTPFRNLTGDESMNEYGTRLDLFHDARVEYIDWANNHKTMILLNGGMMSHLVEFETFLNAHQHSFAWAAFREEEAALNNALTNIGIVLPEHMYAYTRDVLEFHESGFSTDVIAVAGGVQLIFERFDDNEPIKMIISKSAPRGSTVLATTVEFGFFEIELLQRLNRLKLMGA